MSPDYPVAMRRALAGLLILLLSGCGALPAPPTGSAEVDPTTEPSIDELVAEPPPGAAVRFDRGRLSEDLTMLTITLVGGPRFDPKDPCSNAYAGWAAPVGDTLHAAVVDVTPPHPPVACMLLGFTRSVTVTLPEPFEGFKLHDRAGFDHFLRRPDGVVELAAVPVDWLLVSDEEVMGWKAAAWSRIWSRTDAQPTSGIPGHLGLYQAFGGRVEAGTNSGVNVGETVKVRGQDARLLRSPGDGEMLLIWTVGDDELMLDANIVDFSVDEMIQMAERAT